MHEQEAEKILIIMTSADGGCTACVKELFNHFKKEFPEFSELADKVWSEWQ